MFYKMKIAGLDRALPICRVTDELYIAGFVIFGDQELTVACARELLKLAPEYDYLITAEAKGIPLAHEMARQHGDAKYMLARKATKLYMQEVFEVAVRSITTDRIQLAAQEAGYSLMILCSRAQTDVELQMVDQERCHDGGIGSVL